MGVRARGANWSKSTRWSRDPASPPSPPPPPFEYHWEQRSWHPATRRLDCRIHFVVPPGGGAAQPRIIRNAFRYDWRLWTVSELTTLLRQAGFAAVQLWRHTADRDRGAAGIFLGPVPAIPKRKPWVAYLVALR